MVSGDGLVSLGAIRGTEGGSARVTTLDQLGWGLDEPSVTVRVASSIRRRFRHPHHTMPSSPLQETAMYCRTHARHIVGADGSK